MNSSDLGTFWTLWRRRKKTTRREMDQAIFINSENNSNNTSASTAKTQNHTIRRSRKRYPLISYDELPDYMKDNEFILNYYRANWPLKQALLSLLRWHNETLNVWTHLLGFALFLGLALANLIHVPQLADLFGIFSGSPASGGANISRNVLSESTMHIDLKQPTSPEMVVPQPYMAATQWPFFVFLGGAMYCLLSSSTCHLFACHSHSLNLLLLRMDYFGITVMIITSFFPPIYYIFQCEPIWQIVYLTGISVFGLFTSVTLLSPTFATGKFRPFRALLFVAMGLFGLIPAIHATIVNWNDPRRNLTLAYEAAMALSYLVGTAFYVSRVPERWKPGMFDLAGQSHQIFHIFVVLGALAHYGAALVYLKYRGSVSCERMK